MNNTEEKNYIFGIRAIIEAVEAGLEIESTLDFNLTNS